MYKSVIHYVLHCVFTIESVLPLSPYIWPLYPLLPPPSPLVTTELLSVLMNFCFVLFLCCFSFLSYIWVKSYGSLFFSFYILYLSPCPPPHAPQSPTLSSPGVCHSQAVLAVSSEHQTVGTTEQWPPDHWLTQNEPGLLSTFFLLQAWGLTCRAVIRLPCPLAFGQSPRRADWSWEGGQKRWGVYFPSSLAGCLRLASPEGLSPGGVALFPTQPSPSLHSSNCFLLSSLEDEGWSGSLAFTSPGCTCGLHTSLPV